jgi:hypothetical protein
MAKRIILLLYLFLIFPVELVLAQQTSYTIAQDKLYIDANDPLYKGVKPGDTLLFLAGNRNYLLIKNFQGTAGKPIIMINSGGKVIIDTDNYYGISIQNCRYLKFTGTGDPNQLYGFHIKRVANGAGMGIGDLSSDFEIDHIAIENTLIGGLYAKTDPDCTLKSVRGTFTQYNTIIHDNYISNTGDEGLYVGSTFYDGQKVQCNGQNVLLLPGLLDGVKIYNNIIKYSGWDGIQVSSASKNCRIYNNTILFDSQDGAQDQMSGIMIGGGTKCDCYNNFVSQGKGNGIECHGLRGTRIFNNIIIDAGLSFAPTDLTQMKYGIYISDLAIVGDTTLSIQHNDIINPKSDGIRFSNVKSKNNLVAANVIINPGNFDYYQNGNTSFKGIDSYIMLQNKETAVVIQNNYLARNSNLAGFASTMMLSPVDFKLGISSPLVNQGGIDKNVVVDFDGTPRPFGPKSDIGAFELVYDLTSAVIPPIILDNKIKLLQNPAKEFLIFSLPQNSNSDVFLKIYDLTGKMILQYRESELFAENRIVQANISTINSGTYIYTIRTGEYAGSGKFIIRK